MKGLIIAAQFLTRLPFPSIAVDDDAFARSMRWFPAVGLLIGLFLTGGAQLLRGDAWIAALAVLLLWIGITGALHIDGLADLADAVGAGHKDPARFRAVMADPHVGSFGVVAIMLLLLAKLVLLRALIEQDNNLPLLLIPFAARIGPLIWARWLPPLHAGLGARFADAVGWPHIAFWFGLLIASTWLVPAMLAAPLLIALWALWLKRRVGGVSGDCHGAGIELVEVGLFAIVVTG
ncbi:adenosylcobinamide-GDP ribazoletransferase [Sphingobium terrigena]|uniref:Adenosylcobinamide-GDP ribazoletransferase n=1 Tax=Sphingobium terrigena TaxID=2304063 RepID=A0A418YVG7_9SPHN|nr:adenosylcobinamide-GDP ribazoletransferase [Sphingobium terrigena]RJG56189.1 adenosylcobinamide-GDP ribazoletransferase [Sphingobium terrigena]